MHVVVVGGGFGGVKTALELSNKPGIKVTLISNTNNFEYHGALYRTATGRSPLEVTIPLRQIFINSTNVSIVLDKATVLEPHKNIISSETGTSYHYDVLVLALGNQVNYFGIDGMQKEALSMITVPETIALRHRFVQLVKSSVEHPHIVIVGAGATGVELSGDLQTFADNITQKYGLERKFIRVSIIEGASRVLPLLKPKLSEKALIRLSKLGVTVRLNTKVNSCEPGKLCLDTGDIHADLIVWTAGSRLVEFFNDNAKYFTFSRGRIAVDSYLRAEGHKDIYVVGDNAATKYSGMAQTALHDAKYVSRILIGSSKGKSPVKYTVKLPVYVVPIGPRWAVLQNGQKMITGYRAWLVRRRADLWIFKNFEPYAKAVKQWRKGNREARF
jgi:NADH dehydrogenase